jgi:hypothetical protein
VTSVVAMRKSMLLGAAMPVVALIVAVALLARPQAPPFSIENFDRIRKGMSLPEVEAILGPPGDYRTGPTVPVDSSARRVNRYPPGMTAFDWSQGGYSSIEWESDTAFVHVTLVPPLLFDGKVASALHMDMKPEQGPLERLLSRAKRQWRKWFP